MPAPARTDAPADLVLSGGRVFTADRRRPWASAVAIRGERIVAVGDTAAVAALVGPATRRADLAGRLLVPGFQDAHIHTMSAGLASFTCDLHELRGEAAYGVAIAAWAAAHPDAPWVVGEGWSMDDFAGGNPRREALDAAVPDRPAFLWSRDGHSGWTNTRALELAGIGRDSPDPPGGWVVRDADGAPTGTVHEGAVAPLVALIPPDTPDQREQAVLASQARLHAFGVTAWQEVSVRPPDLEAWLALAARGSAGGLTGRVVAGLYLDRDGADGGFEQVVAMRARAGGAAGRGRFRATHVKLFQDGIVENFTAAMLEPYHGIEDGSGDRRGASVVPPERLNADVARLDALGFHVHIHAIGDRAVREGLDAVEAAIRTNPPRDRRHQLAHIQVIHPDDIARFASLGVIPNGQPYWACREGQMDRLTIPFLGPVRTAWQYPFRSLVDAGASLAFGSDWMVSTPNPLLEIEVAVTRVSDAHRNERPAFLPEQRLDLATALTAFTAGSAQANGLDAETGTIEVGKAADLALIDRDLFDPAAGPIGDARVLLTLVGGDAVFEDPALEA
jgi:predicted amidohydrolase YtcJ